MNCYHKGIDIFYSDPDKPPVQNPRCTACGAKMTVERRKTFRSWTEAMAKRETDSYIYCCPNSGKDPHSHLVELYSELEDLKSERLKAIVQEEIDEKRKKFKS